LGYRHLYRAVTAYVIVYGAVAAWAPYLSVYYNKSLGLALGLTGLLMAMTSTVTLFGGPIWGALHDRWPGSRLLLPAAALLASAGALGLYLSGPTPFLPVSAAVFAAGASGLTPMMDVRVLEMVSADRTRYARVRLWGSLSFIVMAPLIGLLTAAHGLPALFWVMVPCLLAGGLAANLMPGRPNAIRTASMFRAPAAVLRQRSIAVFLIGSFFGWAAISSQYAFFTIYLVQLGASTDLAGWAWSVQALLEVPAMFLFPVLARRFGLERLIVLGALIVVAREAANALFLDPRILIAASVVQGLGYSLLLIGSVTFISHQAPKGTAATAQGIFNAVAGALAAIVGSGLGGQLAGLVSIRGLYFVSTGMGVLSAVLIAAAVLPSAVLPAARPAVPSPSLQPAVPAGSEPLAPEPLAPEPLLDAPEPLAPEPALDAPEPLAPGLLAPEPLLSPTSLPEPIDPGA
jgi:PPP family 3-phenylpropionic acid transporter